MKNGAEILLETHLLILNEDEEGKGKARFI
jgi:hypothetical protein